MVFSIISVLQLFLKNPLLTATQLIFLTVLLTNYHFYSVSFWKQGKSVGFQVFEIPHFLKKTMVVIYSIVISEQQFYSSWGDGEFVQLMYLLRLGKKLEKRYGL